MVRESILASILLHCWTNFTLQTVEGTLRTGIVFYIGTLWAFVVLITVVYEAKALARSEDIPNPTLKSDSGEQVSSQD